MKTSVRIALFLSAVAACWWFYQAGQDSTELKYQKILADLNAQSAASKKQSEVKINDIETQRIAQAQDADARVSTLQKRLDDALKPKPHIPHPSGEPACRVPDDAVRVLSEAVSDPRIPVSENTTGFVDPEEAVTTDTAAAYSFYVIEQYNNCASDMNALQRMVK